MNIYKYVGENLGSYQPIVRLVAPTKSQVFAVNTTYTPTQKTSVFGEIALSNNDANLFSSIDDDDNQGLATQINLQQQLLDKEAPEYFQTPAARQVPVYYDSQQGPIISVQLQELFGLQFHL